MIKTAPRQKRATAPARVLKALQTFSGVDRDHSPRREVSQPPPQRGNALRNADVRKEVRDANQGHGENGVSREYGSGYYVKTLNESVQRIAYEHLDLARLHGLRSARPELTQSCDAPPAGRAVLRPPHVRPAVRCSAVFELVTPSARVTQGA